MLAVIASACGGTAAAPSVSPTRLATAAVIRTAVPTLACPGIPSQPATKATVTLEKGGTIVIQLRPEVAPKTVTIFAAKAKSGFYNGLTFHRVVANFVAQGGDPKGDGTGGGQECTELSDLPFVKGAVGVARGGDITVSNDSQFFLCTGECLHLNKLYTNFGQVISGQDVADKIAVGDKIKTITVE
ncbi:MAG TPA: peptidylprolyl isomerase [Candidatus Limnocylindria bacterium]|nr:peptidylprolyl isomerase [Candidatus Limnocylindria bacterium]